MKVKKRYTLETIIGGKFHYYFSSDRLAMVQAIAESMGHYRILDGARLLEEK